MGHVIVKTKVGDPAKASVLEVEAVGDTGATLTVIPQKTAEQLGLKVTGESMVHTGAGSLKLPRSRAWVEMEGKSEILPVLVSDVIDRVLIGVTALEILGFTIDPITAKLKEWTPLLY